MALKQHIDAFFDEAVTRDRAIVFTTFSLDEQVLVQLLREHLVPTDQRIVVFHDVMKHRAPGFLGRYYANSLVVSQIIVKDEGPANRCPVFHSKLWLAVEKHPFLCRVLAVPSLNLSRFHLDAAYCTFDAFPWWSKLALRLDELTWMSPEVLFDLREPMRREIPCATILVDARNGKPTLLSSRDVQSLQLIKDVLDGEEPLHCAAPFVSERAIEKLSPNAIAKGRPPRVWMMESSDGCCLHAKLIGSKKWLLLGSTNLTCQALGIGKFLNHETVLVASRNKLRLDTVLRKFRPVDDFRKLRAPEPPGDIDETESAGERWDERHRQAIAGPRRVLLLLIDGRPEVRIEGKLDGVTKIEILSDRKGVPTRMNLAARKTLRFVTHESQVKLANIIICPPVEVRGLRGRKTVWTRELDFGDFWEVLESNSLRLTEMRSALQKSKQPRKKTPRDREKKPPRSQSMRFSDVRESRGIAFRNIQRGRKGQQQAQEWIRWLTGLNANLPVESIPIWCLDLAKQFWESGDA